MSEPSSSIIVHPPQSLAPWSRSLKGAWKTTCRQPSHHPSSSKGTLRSGKPRCVLDLEAFICCPWAIVHGPLL